MKIKEGFELQNVCGEYLIISAGEENVDFSKIISLNESAAYLWEHLQALQSFDVDNMVELLMQEYDVEPSIAREDCEAMLKRWLEVGLVEE